MDEVGVSLTLNQVAYIPLPIVTDVYHMFLKLQKSRILPHDTLISQSAKIQGAAERTPQFRRGIASGGERIQWWGALHRTAVYVPFSMYTMAWLGEHRAFIVEEFIKKMAARR